jgi:hypothetical protein
MDIIDYALPMQKAQEALKEMHVAMLARDHEQALDRALDAMVEVRMAYNAIRHDQETQVR